MNFDTLMEYKKYTLSKVKAHLDEFNPFMLEQVDIFESRCDKAEASNKIFVTLKANKELLDDEEEDIKKEVYKYLSFGYKKLDSLTPDVLKIYFPDPPSSVGDNLVNMLKMYKSVLVIIENDEYDELNDLRDKYITSIALIEEFISKEEKFSYLKEDNKKENKKNIDSGASQYSILKIYFKAHFYEKERDYRYFFKDLGNIQPKKRDNSENIKNINNI